MPDDVAVNLRLVREAISLAAQQSGRQPSEVTLIGVTKTVPIERIQMAIDCGLSDLGENRVQEAMEKMDALDRYVGHWHLIGTLQTNKVRYILPRVKLIHSLDRWALAQELESRAEKLELRANCLVEVNIAGEASKAGFSPAEVTDFVKSVASECPHVMVQGLMTVAPPANNPEEVRGYFRQMRQLFNHLSQVEQGYRMTHLSMGMSSDFTVAIAEGSTMVRIGTAIFGRR